MLFFARRLVGASMVYPLALGLSVSTRSTSSGTAAAAAPAAPGAKTKTTCRVAVIQMKSGAEKAVNLKKCRELLEKAASTGADLLVLPEVWNSPYAVDKFRENAEAVEVGATGSGPSVALLQAFAREHAVCIVGGSVPELSGGAVYNTAPVVDAEGIVVAKHRKIHLFDIDVPGKIRFFESETLAPGPSRCVTALPHALGDGQALGVAICYDMRFAELAISMCKHGATVIVYPGAFNTVTGPPHYKLLARARALDSQAFVVAASPARNPASSYQAYGHSVVVDPWGTVVVEAEGHDEEILVCDLDLHRVHEVRASMRLLDQRRPDVY